MPTFEERAFRLVHRDDPQRVVRGVITLPVHGEGPPACVLVVHGFMGFMRWGFFPLLAERLAARGFAAVRFDLSGSGVGEDGVDFSAPAALENDTPSRSLEDIALVRAFVEGDALGIDSARCALVGHSRGGALALLHACERPDTRAVVTWNAISTFARWDAATRAAWRRDGCLPVSNGRTGQVFRLSTAVLDDLDRHGRELEPTERCRALELPVLLLCGAADETVAPEASESLKAVLVRADARLERIEGAGHTFGARHPFAGAGSALERALSSTLCFLGRHLEDGPA